MAHHRAVHQSFTGVPGEISTSPATAVKTIWTATSRQRHRLARRSDDLIDPVPDLPACLRWELFPEDQRVIDPEDNPLLVVDDADAAGGDLGADVTVCLPRTTRGSGSATVQADPASSFDWFARVAGWSADGVPESSELIFDYSLAVQNTARCRFESEPNNSFDDLVRGR